MLIYSIGKGVHAFTLDPSLGEFILSSENIRMPITVRFIARMKAISGNGMSQFVITFVTFIVMRVIPLAIAVRW
jgi:fructose-1,6-bisphosphatase